MNRNEFEKYIGRYVKITLFDDDVIEGILFKHDSEQLKKYPGLYIPEKRYILINDNKESCLFRVSHVKKLEICYWSVVICY